MRLEASDIGEKMNDCQCNETGWVKARVPQIYQHEYRGATFEWAGCNVEEHRLNADDEPPDDETQPDPPPYNWETDDRQS